MGSVKISVSAVLRDLQSGTSKDQLQAKYGLSDDGLERVFTELVKRGPLTDADIAHWKAINSPGAEQTDQDTITVEDPAVQDQSKAQEINGTLQKVDTRGSVPSPLLMNYTRKIILVCYLIGLTVTFLYVPWQLSDSSAVQGYGFLFGWHWDHSSFVVSLRVVLLEILFLTIFAVVLYILADEKATPSLKSLSRKVMILLTLFSTFLVGIVYYCAHNEQQQHSAAQVSYPSPTTLPMSAQKPYQAVLPSASSAVLRSTHLDGLLKEAVDAHKNGNTKKAIEMYSKYIIQSPRSLRSTEALNWRGMAYEELGMLDEALTDYDRAIGINSKYAEAFNNRGEVYRKQNNYAAALKDYRTAIELEPGFAEPYYNMGLVYEFQGNRSAAVEQFRNYLKANPTAPDKSEILRKISGLGSTN